MARMPSIFVAHGAPLLAIDAPRAAPLAAWGRRLPRARAILVVSAHWETEQLSLGSYSQAPGVIYDFGSRLPAELFRMTYAAPGAPELAARVRELLRMPSLVETPQGLDHGAWIPLRVLFPEADIPTLQLSLPRRASAAELIALGEALAPLREEGVLLVGSGNVVHNLSTLDISETRPPAPWAVAFDTWIKERTEANDGEALASWTTRAPSPLLAHPTDEHLRPFFVSFGAGDGAPVSWALEGFEHGNTSRRCAQFG